MCDLQLTVMSQNVPKCFDNDRRSSRRKKQQNKIQKQIITTQDVDKGITLTKKMRKEGQKVEPSWGRDDKKFLSYKE